MTFVEEKICQLLAPRNLSELPLIYVPPPAEEALPLHDKLLHVKPQDLLPQHLHQSRL